VSLNETTEEQIRVGMISLGCAKNLVDAEIMLGSLMKEGIEITNEASEADVVIVNTCSFIDAAQEESVDTILESDELRKQYRPEQGLIVSGCLPQRYRKELPKLLPEVDAFMGIDQVGEISGIVKEAYKQRATRVSKKKKRQSAKRLKSGEAKAAPEKPLPSGASVQVHQRPNFIPDFETPRFRLTPNHFAYVKIAEGCNHPCSFCIIPRMRGSHRSRQQADIVKESKQLIRDGVKELNLISQDSTYYGMDLRPGHRRTISSPERFQEASESLPKDSATLCTLIRELNDLRGQFWIRLLYTHPAHWTDELIETIAASRKVAKYVDMPLQHIHQHMLERMRRETTQEYIVNLIDRIRKGIPGIALRTTFIVGFPGETDARFQTLLDFINDVKFERLGVFTYSHEEGTRAANMASQISDEVKQERRDMAMAAQREVMKSLGSKLIGKKIKVLVESEASAKDLQKAKVSSWEHGLLRDDQQDSALPVKGHYCVARGEADAPDIDGRVYVKGHLPLGKFAKVKIVGATDYDLVAAPV
jgi:ribosomal protein S12 methylthiotransferase